MTPPSDFHAFTIKFDGIAAKIVTDVRVSEAFDTARLPDAPPAMFATKALWDTGATNSLITETTALALGISPAGVHRVNHVGGSSLSNIYIVNVFLPNDVVVPGVSVSTCADMVGDFGVIIGMDIIAAGDFSITNVDHKTCMTFRTPSIKRVDYVVEANRIRFARIDRNAPCPCGKIGSDGKPVKFKKCCRHLTEL